MKSTLVAYLLWAFLGGLGAHRFYLGRWMSGLVYLGLFVVGLLTGGIGYILTGVLLFIDMLAIPNMVRTANAGTGAISNTATATNVINITMPGTEAPKTDA